MIDKIIKIHNVGRFENYVPTGDTQLKKLSVIYGENGRGKTTLAAIFRSLKKNDPIYISERSTLGNENIPYIELRVNNENHTFKDNAWNKTDKNIEIFDSAFINENVFSGESVEHGHKKNLYHFVVGEKGVQIALSVDSLDNQIREKGNEIAAKAAEIQRHVVGSSISIQDFISLTKIQDIENFILQKEKEVEIIKKSTLITSKPALQKLILPEFPQEDIKRLFAKQLDGISKEAQQKTKEHIKDHLDAQGESWIQRGLAYIKSGDCPFCGQNCDGIDLIDAYRGYFDEEYKKLKNDIISEITKIKNLFSESALVYVQKNYNSNESLEDFWSQYIVFEKPELSFEEMQTAWKELRDLSIEHLNLKSLSPLDSVQVSDALKLAIEEFDKINVKIFNYNIAIEKINEAIQKKKLAAGGGDLLTESKELEKMRSIKNRHTDVVNLLCTKYKELADEKKEMEKGKRGAKVQLDQYTEDIFKKYQESINKYLKKIGAGFEIVETKTAYSGGKPSSNYCIKINNVSVGLGDTNTYGEPCFRNILSQGDKNSLAFAFFLAKIERDEDISKKVVIFDDPISSLDGHRKSCTENEIINVSKKANQCIVLSHDKYFLRSLWNCGATSEVKSLFVDRAATGSHVKEWDILTDTMGGYFDDYYKILDFTKNGIGLGNLKSLARRIRPVIEGYLRIKYPQDFKYNEWLGDFIKKLENAQSGEVLSSFTSLDELKEINNFSKKYHHKDNPSADTEEISDTELKSFVERAINLISC